MSRRVLLVVGAVLAILGALALWRGGIPYRDREKVLDIGPVEATAETEKEVEIPPLLAGVVLAAGVGFLVVGAARRSG
ncbi:MAG TPA: hypothetical protein VE173_09720 [Longimicrobiales bacterium]|nr:hypothetical protein [Longimicrobiales bacterium]